MKGLIVGALMLLAQEEAMATAYQTWTDTIPCTWVVKVVTPVYHGVARPAESWTTEPECVLPKPQFKPIEGKPIQGPPFPVEGHEKNLKHMDPNMDPSYR